MITLTQEIDRLDYWHELIKPAGVDASKLYATFTLAEIAECFDAQTPMSMVKELCDVAVTSRAGQLYAKLSFQQAYYCHLFKSTLFHIEQMTQCRADKALKAVNDSNFSKLILPQEIEAAADHFTAQGIMVRIEPLKDGDYYGAYSTHDQTVNGKLYEANKLLKSHVYAPVDETVHFWL